MRQAERGLLARIAFGTFFGSDFLDLAAHFLRPVHRRIVRATEQVLHRRRYRHAPQLFIFNRARCADHRAHLPGDRVADADVPNVIEWHGRACRRAACGTQRTCNKPYACNIHATRCSTCATFVQHTCEPRVTPVQHARKHATCGMYRRITARRGVVRSGSLGAAVRPCGAARIVATSVAEGVAVSPWAVSPQLLKSEKPCVVGRRSMVDVG